MPAKLKLAKEVSVIERRRHFISNKDQAKEQVRCTFKLFQTVIVTPTYRMDAKASSSDDRFCKALMVMVVAV